MNAIYLLNKATPSNCVFNSAKKVAPKASLQLIPANTLINKYTTNVVTKGHTLAFLSSFSSSYKKNTSLTSSLSFSFLSCNLRIVTIAATPTIKNKILAINKAIYSIASPDTNTPAILAANPLHQQQ